MGAEGKVCLRDPRWPAVKRIGLALKTPVNAVSKQYAPFRTQRQMKALSGLKRGILMWHKEVCAFLNRYYFSAVLSLGRVTFKKTATKVAITTGDLPKIVVTQSGKAASEAEACDTPIPKAAASPTIEVLR